MENNNREVSFMNGAARSSDTPIFGRGKMNMKGRDVIVRHRENSKIKLPRNMKLNVGKEEKAIPGKLTAKNIDIKGDFKTLADDIENKLTFANPFKPSKDHKIRHKSPALLDSQRKKFIGKTVSELKKEVEKNIVHDYDLPETILDPISPVAIYADGIHSLLLKHEKEHGTLYGDYMERIQDKGIASTHRRIMINYMVNFHYCTKIKDEQTLFLAVQLMDRYLNGISIKPSDLQGIGSAGLLIAEKYEEIYPNQGKTFVKAAANAFTEEQLKNAERTVGKVMKFQIELFPTPYILLKRFLFVIELEQTETFFALFVLEALLHDYDALKIKPSMQAISAILNARMACDNLDLACHTQDTISIDKIKLCLKQDNLNPIQIYDVADTVADIVKNCLKNQHKFKNVCKKFRLMKYNSVSNWTLKD